MTAKSWALPLACRSSAGATEVNDVLPAQGNLTHWILLGSHDFRVLGWLEPALRELGVGVLLVDSGEELERTLLHGGTAAVANDGAVRPPAGLAGPPGSYRAQ